ncbi:MAG TPA: Type 1 glutamine amidotransferase-like domain-containing protein [Polyangiaceae bacterium]|jgi:peptidase E|nr:Type 1 glutamine amidotransferase-like domain-containing protein [Polyangiaceae bacterium]
MTYTLDLVGGGPGAVLAVRRHFKAALDAIGRPRPLVAYVGVASDDNAGFFAMIRAGLGSGGATIKLAKIASRRSSASEARELLESCDLVLMSGGDVDHGMNVLHDRDMTSFLVALGRAGKPMFGISAGSLMLASHWVRFPDDDEAKAELFPCLGLAPLHVDAHSEEDGWSELRVLVRLLHERGDAKPVGYGLTRHGGLHVSVSDEGVAFRPIGTPTPRFVVRRGKAVEATPLPLPR